MRIVVNNIAASSGGAMTVLKDFYTCVCENDTENEWIFLLGDRYFEERENVKIIALPDIKKNPIKKVIFDFFTGKKFINNLKPDVVFSMQNIITFGLKAPQVVYVHQPLPFQDIKRFSFLKTGERGLAFKQHIIGKMIKRSVRKADKAIVQTDWMQESVSEKSGVSKEKVIKVFPRVKYLSKPTEELPFDSKNFFYPTSGVLYKNNGLVFSACRILKAEDIEYKVELTIPAEKSAEGVRCIGRIPYEEVVKKYSNSTLVFPSYIETFGYPLAEARQLGAIVLAADTAFARELLKGYSNAYFFDPFKADELAELMKRVISGEIQREKANETYTQVEDSWKTIMNEVIGLYQ